MRGISSPILTFVNIDLEARREYLAFALQLAQHSGRLIRRQVARGFTTELKADASFVTAADVAAERALRRTIAKTYPGHGIVGEEGAAVHPDSEYQWILDPIDGTENFAFGTPTFGTIIALHYRGAPVVGVVNHPQLRLCYGAARGLGAFCNARRVTVGDYAHLRGGREIVAVAAAENFNKSGDIAVLERLQRAFPNTRTYRDCFAHTRAVQGSVAAVVDVNLNLWDVAACQVLIEEAGGRFETVNTREFDGKTYYSVVFGAPATVARLLPLLFFTGP